MIKHLLGYTGTPLTFHCRLLHWETDNIICHYNAQYKVMIAIYYMVANSWLVFAKTFVKQEMKRALLLF